MTDPIILPDGSLSPGAKDAVMEFLLPILGTVARETGKRVARQFPAAVWRSGTVVSVDPSTGSVEVVIDGDAATNPSAALCVGPAPTPDTRCEVVFAPNGGLLCIGTLGAARIVLALTGDVSLVSDDHPFQIGESNDHNIAFDSNEIQARDGSGAGAGSVAAPLYLNHSGGNVELAGRVLAGLPPTGTAGAYIGHASTFTTTAYGIRFGSDGTVLVNSSAGGFVDIRDSGSLSLFRVQPDGSNHTQINTIAGLAVLGGVGLTVAYLGNQIGVTGSSRRFKQDIVAVDTQDMLDRALRLQPVRFRYRPEVGAAAVHVGEGDPPEPAPSAPALGLIAEDVVGVVPEVVVLDDDGEPFAVNYEALVPVLLGAIHRLSERVDSLVRAAGAQPAPGTVDGPETAV